MFTPHTAATTPKRLALNTVILGKLILKSVQVGFRL